MSAGGNAVKAQREKSAKMNSSSPNGKPETSKNQPTAEQIRLAQITSDRPDGDPEIATKVNQIIDLTGRSSDEVMTVLYDCDYDISRTVEKLLESHEAIVDEWQVIDKKKKLPALNKGSPSEVPSDLKLENIMESEFELNNADRAQRGRTARGVSRFPRGRNRASWSDRTDRSHDRETGYEANRGHQRGSFVESRGRGGRRGGRSMHSNRFETQIDTWTSESTPNGENDSRIGPWTDVTDEWTADEWNGSLNESCVFTPSAFSRSVKINSAPNDVNGDRLPSAVHRGTAMTFESSNRADQDGMPGDVSPGVVGGASFSSLHPPGQNSISQHYVAKEPSPSSTVNQVESCYGNSMPNRTMCVSHYNKEATECIKSVMGIGRSSCGQNSQKTTEMVRQPGHQPQVSLQQSSSSQGQGVKQPRPRLPPPSKIPSTPVEMPGSVNGGRLDVQFGSWDAMPPAANDISFISDIIPPVEYKGTAKISLSQTSSVAGRSVKTPPLVSSFEPNTSKSQATSESHATPASKPGSFPPASKVGNETLHHTMVPVSVSSSDLLTSVTKASGVPPSSQLGFSQLAYPSSSSEGAALSASGTKLLLSNGSGYYGSSFGYHSGPSPLVTMSSDFGLMQGQMQYTYGDSHRYGVSGPQQTPQSFGSTPFPHGHTGGPLTDQLHYHNSQVPAKLFTSEKPGTGGFSMGPDVTGLYNEKQGTTFSVSLPQSFDSSSVYQPAGGFQSVSQPGIMSLSYPGMAASGLNFQGMHIESSGFNPGQYPGYRQKESPVGYDTAGASDGQRNAVTTCSGVPGQTGQPFASNLGSGSGQGQATQSTSGSLIGQGQSVAPKAAALGAQGQGVSSAGTTEFASHAPGLSFGGQVEGSPSPAAVAQSGLTNSLDSIAETGGKLPDSVSKSNLKDGQQGDSGTVTADDAGIVTSGSAGSGAVTSSETGAMALASKASLSAASKSSPSQGHPLTNMAPGMTSGNAAILNHNYMIGQPPGFQLAAFGYPGTQQPLTYSSFEELQMLQQRFSNMSYYDMALQTSAALAGRDSNGIHGMQSYTGNDVKLAAMDVLSQVNAQPNPQPQVGSQQTFINHALHPAYSYYYPGPTGILPYYPMVPMAIPSVSNPALAGTTSTTQYQKPIVFGSHAYAMGGQAQDYAKTFGSSQVPGKPNAGMATGDLMAGTTGFGKTLLQTFERGGFHGGTSPPAFNVALPGGTQAPGGLGAPTVYGPPYVPMVPHQQSHSQLLHHAIPQDSAVAGRPTPPTGVQQKMGGNKTYNATYWGSN